MRRRLALVSLATTALIVLALLIPLGLLVRRQAADSARVQAEREAQATASLIALAVTLDPDPSSVPAALGPLPEGVTVVLSDGTSYGVPLEGQGSLVDTALSEQATITALVDGGWEIALPVIGVEGAAVVDIYVTDAQLTEGVAAAWMLLGVLGLVMIGLAVLVADRLGQSLVRPIGHLAAAAHRFGDGDLETRVPLSDPPEIREVGEAFNLLATRLDHLLTQEREAVADLSHRLRTPLASLRLQAERLSEDDERSDVLAQVDRLEEAVDRLIVAARARDIDQSGICVLDEVVAERAAFWKVLADEKGREMRVVTGAAGVALGMAAETIEAAVDTLIDNVFAHTPDGTAFTVTTGESAGRPFLEVADEGPGFLGSALLDRGVSGAGSTGLGLDIVRKTANLTGGGLETNDRPGGGAVVRVWFG